MNIFGQLVNIFQRKKQEVVPAEKNEIKKKQESSSFLPTPPPQHQPQQQQQQQQQQEQEQQRHQRKTSGISRVSSVQIKPNQLEFEASRHLLDIDFLESDTTEDLSFPSFEHLLITKKVKRVEPVVEQDTNNNKGALRHRLSLYRPLRSRVKRAKSTPHLGKQ